MYPQDVEMYYSETDTPAMARTSNLNEELGQVSIRQSYRHMLLSGLMERAVLSLITCRLFIFFR